MNKKERKEFEENTVCVTADCRKYSWNDLMNEPSCAMSRPITKGMKKCIYIKDEPTEDKLCPMKLEGGYCQKGKCEWWIVGNEHCTIVVLGELLWQLTNKE